MKSKLEEAILVGGKKDKRAVVAIEESKLLGAKVAKKGSKFTKKA